MRRCLTLFAVIPLALAAPARADVPYERFQMSDSDRERLRHAGYDRCLDESETITRLIFDCSIAELERLDARLNSVYRATMSRLPTRSARLRLRNLERRWLAVRWQECERVSEVNEGGTLPQIMFDFCAVDEVSGRIAWLERYGR